MVKDWSDEEIARRWWNLFPSRRNKDGSPAEPAETDLKPLMADAKDARIEHGESAGWLAPVELEPKRKKVREKCSSRRASNKGCVFMSLAEYLELLDWTGRQVKPGKRGSVAKKVPPILDRLNLSAELWLQTIAGFAKLRSANSVTPASRFNAAANTTLRLIKSDR